MFLQNAPPPFLLSFNSLLLPKNSPFSLLFLPLYFFCWFVFAPSQNSPPGQCCCFGCLKRASQVSILLFLPVFPFFPSTLLLTHSSLHHSATSGPDLLPHHIPLLLACFFSSSQTFRHELRLQMVFTATNPLLRLHTVKITAANHFKPSLLFYHPQNRTDQVNATHVHQYIFLKTVEWKYAKALAKTTA